MIYMYIHNYYMALGQSVLSNTKLYHQTLLLCRSIKFACYMLKTTFLRENGIHFQNGS